jgi:diguanylate cyclase (GGDEF)-like protein
MGDSVPPSSGASLDAFRWQRRLWAVIVGALALAGCAGALVAAHVQSAHDAQNARAAFVHSSQEVESTLSLEIEHETDLLISAGGFVAGWTRSIQAFDRYPEILGIGHTVIVPASALAAFAAAAVRDPAGPLGPGGRFVVVPAGHRPFYCLEDAGASRSTQDAFPAGFDFCSGALGRASLLARDSGSTAYAPIKAGSRTLFAVISPVYRSGEIPPTVAGRRAAFIGWVGMAVVPAALLDPALAAHPHLRVTVDYRAPGSNVRFSDGPRPAHAQSVTVERFDGWTVRAEYPAPDTGLLASETSLLLALGGVMASLLFGLFVFVLATGRARAWRLVRMQTTELAHQALHDGLTGLPNRALITDRAEQLMARARRHGSPGAVLFIDLDEFKNVNDTLGHHAGDELLRVVATRLVEGLREVDTVGRLGGDEFVILIEDGTATASALVAERLLALMREPFQLPGASGPTSLTASVGIATGVHERADELLRDADMALYRAKARGKDGYEIFRPEMESELRHQLDIELEMRSALERAELRLVYQPIFAISDLSLVGVEALLRWEHPRLGQIPPADFLPLLEATGQIRETDRWVLGRACAEVGAWHATGGALGVGVGVNLSASSLEDDAIVAAVATALEEGGLEPDALTIEISERSLAACSTEARERVDRIRALGVSVAIDDFGVSCAWVTSLEDHPVDAIKIDGTFSAALGNSAEARALLAAFTSLGRGLGLRTLAEGVETIEALEDLREIDVDQVQGFLLSRPLSREAAAKLTRSAARAEPSPSR